MEIFASIRVETSEFGMQISKYLTKLRIKAGNAFDLQDE